ncbi:hypothetical protein SDC9_157791 [bioreactor metagenome]|uniref:Uncharacterized protein n=1 Tax=bioreactor metagenome TaxID=1076179 RepID=A0A645FA55_9ZZZZ
MRMYAIHVPDSGDFPPGEFGCMAYLKSDLLFIVEFPPGILGDKVESLQVDQIAILMFCIVSPGDINDVAVYILFDHKPGAAAQTKPFALPDGVEPESLMSPQYIACLQLHNQPLLLSQVAFDKIIVIYLTQEADTLAVFALCGRQLLLGGDGAYFRFQQIPDGEHQF